MKRKGFLKALAGLGAVAAVPSVLKAEEEFAITSSDGRTAWDSEGNEVYAEGYDLEGKPYYLMTHSKPVYNGFD